MITDTLCPAPSERSDGKGGGEAALPAAGTCLPYPRLPGTHSGESQRPAGPLGSGPAPQPPTPSPENFRGRPDGLLGNKCTDERCQVLLVGFGGKEIMLLIQCHRLNRERFDLRCIVSLPPLGGAVPVVQFIFFFSKMFCLLRTEHYMSGS